MAEPTSDTKKRHHGLSAIELMRQVLRLRAKGHSWDAIGQSEESQGLVPVSKRHAQRLFKQATDQGLSLDEFETWTVSYSVERGDPPEKVKWLLEAGQQPLGIFGLDRVTADWLWFLHNLRTELTWELLEVLSTRYVDAGFDRNLKWTGRVLDRALALSPWRSLLKAEQFFDQSYEHAPTRSDLLTISDIDLELRWAWRRSSGSSNSKIHIESDIADSELSDIPVISKLPKDLEVLIYRRSLADSTEPSDLVTIPRWGERMRHVMPAGHQSKAELLDNNPFIGGDQ